MHWVTAPPGSIPKAELSTGTAHDGTVSAHNPRRADIANNGSSILSWRCSLFKSKKKGQVTNSYCSGDPILKFKSFQGSLKGAQHAQIGC